MGCDSGEPVGEAREEVGAAHGVVDQAGEAGSIHFGDCCSCCWRVRGRGVSQVGAASGVPAWASRCHSCPRTPEVLSVSTTAEAQVGAVWPVAAAREEGYVDEAAG
jgi:hypothetical protein